jgi:D-Tyr-tRNAtyr deacylase
VTVLHDDGTSEMVGSIGPGLCVLVGVTHDDDVTKARKMAS